MINIQLILDILGHLIVTNKMYVKIARTLLKMPKKPGVSNYTCKTFGIKREIYAYFISRDH